MRKFADTEIEIAPFLGSDIETTLCQLTTSSDPLPAASQHASTRDELTSPKTTDSREIHSTTARSTLQQGVGVPEDMLEALRKTAPTKEMFASSSDGNIAFHDFASYQFLFDPWLPIDRNMQANLRDIAYLNSLLPRLRSADPAIVRKIFIEATISARKALELWLPPSDPLAGTTPVEDSMNFFVINLMLIGMPVLYGPISSLNARYLRYFVDAELSPWLYNWARDTAISGSPARIGSSTWTAMANAAREITRRSNGRVEGPLFVPYSSETVNFGIRLTYRQEWKALGDQYGDIVRTIPLGPRQTEKISVKTMKRNKGTRQMESSQSMESESELSNTVKDSSEIVEEAASSNKWHVDAEASGSIDTIGASASLKVSGGASGEASNNSKDTKSRIGEAMQKSAHKMRRESKVTVTTETEVSYQEDRSSEITNPNDEIAVTYVYQRLQRQYEIHTYLAETASVVYVAEHVPTPGNLLDWIRRYAWIISGTLLDESFRDVLALIANESSEAPTNEFGELVHYDTFMKNAAASVEKIERLPGTLTSLFDATQKSFADISRESREVARYRNSLNVRQDRFLQHIEDNLLHYCRAVWSREDPEQRMMRYSNIMVPAEITFIPDTSGAGPIGRVRGRWQASGNSDKYIPLSDLINPAGPIGYSGNYAVFYLKEDPSLIRHNLALQLMKSPYFHVAGFVVSTAGSNVSSAVLTVTANASSAALQTLQVLMTNRFQVRVVPAGNSVALKLVLTPSDGGAAVEMPPLPLPPSGEVDFLGYHLKFAPEPIAGDVFDVTKITKMRDPELVSIEREYSLPAAGASNEDIIFDRETIEDMRRMVPKLNDRILALGTRLDAPEPADLSEWRNLNESQKDVFRSSYHAYLLRKEHTRRFVVDTNSLVLNLIPGTGSVLEPFKRAHRYIDVLKEANEVTRRQGLINNQNYGDPEIDKVVLIGSNGMDAAVAGIVAGVTENDSREPTP